MTTSGQPVPDSDESGTACRTGNSGDRVVDRVAAWAPDLSAQAEVLTALFGDDLGQRPVGVVNKRAECGSYRAYKQHLTLGEQTCDECRAANAARRRAGRARRGGQVRRARPLGQKKPSCGSNAAYYQHLYYGELPVDPECLAAHSAYVTKTDAARKSRSST